MTACEWEELHCYKKHDDFSSIAFRESIRSRFIKSLSTRRTKEENLQSSAKVYTFSSSFHFEIGVEMEEVGWNVIKEILCEASKKMSEREKEKRNLNSSEHPPTQNKVFFRTHIFLRTSLSGKAYVKLKTRLLQGEWINFIFRERLLTSFNGEKKFEEIVRAE